MPDPVTVAIEGRIAVLQIDNPPVNALSRDVAQALAAALRHVGEASAVDAVVVRGAGKTFVAGADIKDLEAAAWTGADPPDFHELLALVEDCPKPVVMAIHGTALGGGLELAMAAHYRIASPTARLGLPEVNLGIVPGAEGTQRLPRLVGLAKAIEMCVSGKPIDAQDARSCGLVDAIVEDDLTEGAVAFASDAIRRGGAHSRTRDREVAPESPEERSTVLERGRESARKTRRNQTAPIAVLEALEASALSFEEGRRRERGLSLASVGSEQGRALVHAFFAERGVARVPGLPATDRAGELRRAAVVGAGTMGAGIAMACANAGLEVSLGDVDTAAVERGLAAIRRNYQSSVDRGRLTPVAVAERLARIQPLVGFDGCSSAELVIEAVFESLELKKTVFTEIDRRAPAGCVLASNTSTLDIDQIASATKRPEAVVGLHFFSPAHVMRLVEIVRGRATSSEVLATSQGLAKRLGKVGVVVRNATGFVGNRMMFPYMYEAHFLAEEGATPERIDRVLTDWGMAMGIFAVDDLGGLDVAWRIRRELGQFTEPGARRPLVADKLVEMGRLGQKTGRGWFRYGDDRKPIPDPEVVELIEAVAMGAGIRRREIGDAEIRERTLYALVNEGARVLDEGIALRAADIDVIYLTGYGFPGYRGGPMFYADSVGLAAVLERVEALHREHGPRWAPAPLLSRLAAAGSSFREHDASRAAAEVPPA